MYSRSAKGGGKGDPNRNPWLAKMVNHLPVIFVFYLDIYLSKKTVAVHKLANEVHDRFCLIVI